jgi:hypothetical protein
MTIEAFDTYADWQQSVIRVLLQAERELKFFEQHLVDAGCNSIEFTEALKQFARRKAGNQAVFIVHDADKIIKTAPRFTELLKTWGHVFSLRVTQPEVKQASEGILLADRRYGLQRFHFDHARGQYIEQEPHHLVVLRQQFLALEAASEPASGLRVLGL